MTKSEMIKRIEALEAKLDDLIKPRNYTCPDGYRVPANGYSEDSVRLPLQEVIRGLVDTTGLKYIRPIPSRFEADAPD